MAHFAEVDEHGIVLQVVVISNEDITDESGQEIEQAGRDLCEKIVNPGRWIQTSYNGSFRRKYAGLAPGMKYDDALDMFIEPQPYPSWTFDLSVESDWSPPVPMPDDRENIYNWDEETQQWIAHPVE